MIENQVWVGKIVQSGILENYPIFEKFSSFRSSIVTFLFLISTSRIVYEYLLH